QRKYHHCQNIALCKSSKWILKQSVKKMRKKFTHAQLVSFKILHGILKKRQLHARTGLENISNHQRQQHRQTGGGKKINQRGPPDPVSLMVRLQIGDAYRN